MRITFVICEGVHDIAFFTKLLKSEGYSTFHKKINEYPDPLNDWLRTTVQKISIQELNVSGVYDEINTVLPRQALINDVRDQLIMFYNMNGDSRKKEREKFITKLNEWIYEPENEKEFSFNEDLKGRNIQFGLLLTYDADDKGINTRLKDIKEENKKHFPLIENISSNGEIINNGNSFKLGIYIFAEPGKDTGTLENILLPLMKEDNEAIFESADNFLKTYQDKERLKSLIFEKNHSGDIIEKRDRANKYYHIKSMLGVVGQLQYSGASNTVCIEKSDYITLDKIKKNSNCQDILDLFKKF